MGQSLFPKMTEADIHLWSNSDKPLIPPIEITNNGHHILVSTSAIARGYEVIVWDGPDALVFAFDSPSLDVCTKEAQEVVASLVIS